MGTSKSYITPKTPQNKAVKRGITSYINGGRVSISEIASRFATAIKAENLAHNQNGQVTSSGSFKHYGKQIGKVLEFIVRASSIGGISTAITINYADNPPQTPHELFSRLLDEDAIIGTLDNVVVTMAFSLTIERLEIANFEQLDTYDFAVFIKELLANLAMTCFEQRYAAQIQAKANSIAQAVSKLEDLKNYIHNEIIANSDMSDFTQYVANNENIGAYIEAKCAAVFSLLENYI